MSIRLSNAARAAIKSALRGKVAGLDTMTKDELLAAAAAHGFEPIALARKADQDAAQQEATEKYGVLADKMTVVALAEEPAAAYEPAPVADPVAQDVDAVLSDWRDMNVTGFQDKIRALAERANKPAEIVERVVYAGAVGRNQNKPANRTGDFKTARQIVGAKAAPGALGELKLAVWDYPAAPAIDPNYIWPQGSGALLSQMFKRRRPVMVWGPKGSGKTSFAQQLAAQLRRPFVRISCNAQTEGATLTGQTVPAAGGGTEWKDGQLTAAMRQPGTIILVDEPSVARPGAMYVLQAVLDSGELHIDETGEVVKAADGVCIILADNTNGSGDTTGQYGASHEMTAAQRDRPGCTLRIDYLPPAQEAKVVAAKTGCTPQLAALLVGYAKATRAKNAAGDLAEGLGLRRLISWAEMLTDGVPADEAAEGAFLDRVAPEQCETLRQLLVTHCDPKAIARALQGLEPEGQTAAPADGFTPVEE